MRGGFPGLRRALALPLLLALAACQPERVLGSDDRSLLWFVVPFLGFLVVWGFFVHLRRRAQLRRWDLRQPEEPSVKGVFLATILLILISVVAFAGVNLWAEIAPRQQMVNIGMWAFGTLLGGLFGLMLGLRTAEPPPYRPAPEEGL